MELLSGGPSSRATPLRLRSVSACGGQLRRMTSLPSFQDLSLATGEYSESHGVTTVTPEFARAYLQGRKRLQEGALKFPVVRSKADGSIVDCGSVYAWKKGVAPRVLAGELECSVVTFVRNPSYDPTDITSALFTEHSIHGKSGGWARPAQSRVRHPLEAGESSAQGIRRTMEDETVLLMDLNTVLEADPHAHPRAAESAMSFFGVYDGHGGREAAHYAAKNLHFNIARSRSFASDIVQGITEVSDTRHSLGSACGMTTLQHVGRDGGNVVCAGFRINGGAIPGEGSEGEVAFGLHRVRSAHQREDDVHSESR